MLSQANSAVEDCSKVTTLKIQLIRAIGRWSLVALVVNCIIGSGAFGLPSAVAALLGRVSVLPVLLAGAAIAIVMACFADVASQFTDPGGSLPLRAHWHQTLDGGDRPKRGFREKRCQEKGISCQRYERRPP